MYGILRVPDGAPVDIVKGNHRNLLFNLILHPIRTWLSTTLKRSHSGQELAFLQAIILGQRSGIEPEILKDFRDAGTLHILAVSDLHVGFIILIIQSLLMLIRFPGRLAADSDHNFHLVLCPDSRRAGSGAACRDICIFLLFGDFAPALPRSLEYSGHDCFSAPADRPRQPVRSGFSTVVLRCSGYPVYYKCDAAGYT